jgi:hypothetical protein
MGASVLASCLGTIFLTLMLVRVPGIQSSDSGNAGQAFGAAAAATSAVVLIYIARTFRRQGSDSRMHLDVLDAQRAELALQREDARSSHEILQRTAEAAVRGQHQGLMHMAIEDPELAAVWPGYGPEVPEERTKQYLYANLIVSFHCMVYMLNYYTDHEAEENICYLFKSRVIRDFWEDTREARTQNSPYGGKMRKFYELAESAYQRDVDD